MTRVGQGGGNCLRTHIPLQVRRLLNLKQGDSILWRIRISNKTKITVTIGRVAAGADEEEFDAIFDSALKANGL